MSKEKKIKIKRPKAEAPKGFRDYFGSEIRARNLLLQQIMEVYHLYGFEALETSAIETVEALGKFLPDIERPNEGVFAWQEDEGWLALRYDLTAPLARVYAENQNHLPSPYRRYSMGPVWRNEKPGPGRFREFLQFDADFVGTKSLQADAELCVMISEILEKCELSKEEYIVKISSRKITEELFKKISVDGNDQKLTALRALDKIDRLGWEEVKKLLGKGRKDKSGDFTKGANLSAPNIETVEKELNKKLPDTEDLVEIFKIFKYYSFTNFEFDPSIIRAVIHDCKAKPQDA